MTDITPESVKAFVERGKLFPMGVGDQLDALEMLTALSAERDAQTKRANEGWQNALDNANELYRIRQERDTIKATVARLVDLLKCIASPGAYGTEVINKNVGPHDLVTVRITKSQVHAIVGEVAAARETLP